MNTPGPQSQLFYEFEHFFELSPDLLCIAGFDGYFRRINQLFQNFLVILMRSFYPGQSVILFMSMTR